MKNIAILLTCFNRQAKTEICLKSLKSVLDNYGEIINAEVFLTDDGCTDDTVKVAKSIFPSTLLHIVQGTGDLFWAGGMRASWNEALKRHAEWNYYLLINDDVEFLPCVINELFEANELAKDKYDMEGVCSGLTCATDDDNKITYGGGCWKNKLLATTKEMEYKGEPQFCDFTNANILLIPKYVVDMVGIFHNGYRHGKADYDYTCVARRKGIPIVLTAHACGKCDNDHVKYSLIAKKVVSMNLKERISFYNKPVNSIKDYLLLIRRTSPLRYPIVAFGRAMNVLVPKLYYRMKGIHYE